MSALIDHNSKKKLRLPGWAHRSGVSRAADLIIDL